MTALIRERAPSLQTAGSAYILDPAEVELLRHVYQNAY
jgi:hypothetical protein